MTATRTSHYRREGRGKTVGIEPHQKQDSERRHQITLSVNNMVRHLDHEGPRDGTNDTPERVARMWVDELCSGYKIDPKRYLEKQFDSDGYEGMIVVKDIPLTSVCEHHMVPFIGYAHVGYISRDKVVGLSKLARVVDAYARRLQIQERLTQQVADVIEDALDPLGVIVVIEAEHLCMTVRGVQKPGTKTVTSAVKGVFNSNEEGEKEEFFQLLRKGTGE